MKKPLRALIIEDSEFDARLLVNLLRLGDYQVTWRRVDTRDGMRAALDREPWDVILSDHQMPEFSAPEALQLLHDTGRDLPFIIVSGGIGEATAVALMKAGAHDFLIKGQLGRLVPAVERELREADNRDRRRQAERSLVDSERRYRLLWENSPDAILVMDAEGRITFANPAAETVFGFPLAELMNRPFTSLLVLPPAEPGVDPYVELRRAMQGRHTPLELAGRHRDGHELTVDIGFGDLELEGRTWFLAFVRDLTERRRAEAALHLARQEFRAAREIQQRLFPKAAPVVPGYDIAGASYPADEAGGDYFDYLPMLDGGLGVVIGDVSGHGIGPALIMAETRAYLRVVARVRYHPSEVITRANRVLAEDLDDTDRFVSVLFARLDAGHHRLTYCNAGHPTGYVLAPDGSVKHQLARAGRALGFQSDAEYADSAQVTLSPGDLILLLTDGVEEAPGEGDTVFGAQRALEVAHQLRARPAREIVSGLYQAVEDFRVKTGPRDDITVVVVRVLNSDEPTPPTSDLRR